MDTVIALAVPDNFVISIAVGDVAGSAVKMVRNTFALSEIFGFVTTSNSNQRTDWENIRPFFRLIAAVDD